MEAEATFPMRKNREDLLNGPPWKMSGREDAIETPLTEIRTARRERAFAGNPLGCDHFDNQVEMSRSKLDMRIRSGNPSA